MQESTVNFDADRHMDEAPPLGEPIVATTAASTAKSMPSVGSAGVASTTTTAAAAARRYGRPPTTTAHHENDDSDPPLDVDRATVQLDLWRSECAADMGAVYCLNGGSCFNYTIGNYTLPSCVCAVGFMGERCDRKYTNRSYGSKQLYIGAHFLGARTIGYFVQIIFGDTYSNLYT